MIHELTISESMLGNICGAMEISVQALNAIRYRWQQNEQQHVHQLKQWRLKLADIQLAITNLSRQSDETRTKNQSIELGEAISTRTEEYDFILAEIRCLLEKMSAASRSHQPLQDGLSCIAEKKAEVKQQLLDALGTPECLVDETYAALLAHILSTEKNDSFNPSRNERQSQ